jgi:hypothetical protein
MGQGMNDDPIARDHLQDSIKMFRLYKQLAEKAIEQLPNPDRDLFYAPDKESNSIAIIMKHMSGNMRSRWRDFLTTDGEKGDRRRDSEFVLDTTEDRAAIMNLWEEGWAFVFAALEPLRPTDMNRAVMIRRQPHTVVQAINRQLTHYAYHIGQIVFLSKHIAQEKFTSLTVPRGKSEEVNALMAEKFKDSR